MSLFDIDHISVDRADLPDAGGGACCIGAAVYGPGRCTCWEPVYDVEQRPPWAPIGPSTREAACIDCAFRADSPERTGAPRAAHDEDDVRTLAYSDETFWCHDGMRRIIGYRHPTGVEIPAQTADGVHLEYAPEIVNGVPYQADGAPAWRCAGQAARRRSTERGQEANR